IAYGGPSNEVCLSNAFSAADAAGFKLFFSFDYAGNGPWPQSNVISLINGYKMRASYFYYNGKPFVSTFEGPERANDWVTIKGQTNCFFIPDWSSKGAKVALTQYPGIPDGLFNWAAWPYGPDEMYTVIDSSYTYFLKGAPYMMPVSPWFYTNLPGFKKNWLWRGDDLWHDRWQEVMVVQPDFVQIISWNDYGESHYIGPRFDQQVKNNFGIGNPPYDYSEGMPHDGWRTFLPFLIDMYKSNTSTVTNDGLQVWYRNAPSSACSTGGTTGNTLSQLQCEHPPSEMMQDRVFYSALLTSEKAISVTIGGVTQAGTYGSKPYGGVGIYHGSVGFNGRTGAVSVSLSGVGSVSDGPPVSTTCKNNIQNYNPWVGSVTGGGVGNVRTPYRTEELFCVRGKGVGDYAKLCAFGCSYGYCPSGVCTCTDLGGPLSYPVASKDSSYGGLCSFGCNYGFCPEGICQKTEVALSAPSEAGPFPRYGGGCVSGTGQGGFEGLCKFSCGYGFCPAESCTCTATGMPPNGPVPTSDKVCVSVSDSRFLGLCQFACNRAYCPTDVCLKILDTQVCPFPGFDHIASQLPILSGSNEYHNAADSSCHGIEGER
ncbi:glycosyl hydrolase family 71-domain-containing protein, partial [Rhexocercosporidium sp. MPI-PUGE-AT-0058]